MVENPLAGFGADGLALFLLGNPAAITEWIAIDVSQYRS
jgi:hypothetical protein